METQMENLLLVPVDDSVVFPNMTVTLAIDVGDADRVVLVPRKGDDFASVGTIANVGERGRLPAGGRRTRGGAGGGGGGPHGRRQRRSERRPPRGGRAAPRRRPRR